jgi:hypothetical protein
MSAEEERLRGLLKATVPELAAAAVVAIGVTAGALATHHGGSAGRSPVGSGTVGSSAPGSTGTPPHPTTTCQGATEVVPNVVGTTMEAAEAIIQGAGLNVGIDQSVAPAGPAIPVGTVFAQSLAAGSRAVPGAEVVVAVAVTPPSNTASAIDPDMDVIGTGTPSPTSPCQALGGSPPAQGTDARVPLVIGMGRAQAIAAAKRAGFTVSVTVAAPPSGQSLPAGMVFAQSPAAGSTARPGSGMILYVSTGS